MHLRRTRKRVALLAIVSMFGVYTVILLLFAETSEVLQYSLDLEQRLQREVLPHISDESTSKPGINMEDIGNHNGHKPREVVVKMFQSHKEPQETSNNTISSDILLGEQYYPEGHVPPHIGPYTDNTLCEPNSDCFKFLRMLETWPKDKPKACIYYLTQSMRLGYLKKSLESIDKYFNNQFQYPIVIYHEKELTKTVPAVRMYTKSPVFFQEISFEIPDFLPRPVPQKIPCLSRVGYRHMCRFHAKLLYEQPMMKALDYSWRMDDDSFLLRPVDYDVFKFMRDNALMYGYIWKHWDSLLCTEGLWETVDTYVKENNITPTFYEEWPKPRLYYNNFEISDMKLWTSKAYSRFIDYIDRTGGIYYHRWGDAPIKGIAVSLYVNKSQTHFFKDIGYRHGSFTNIP